MEKEQIAAVRREIENNYSSFITIFDKYIAPEAHEDLDYFINTACTSNVYVWTHILDNDYSPKTLAKFLCIKLFLCCCLIALRDKLKEVKSVKLNDPWYCNGLLTGISLMRVKDNHCIDIFFYIDKENSIHNLDEAYCLDLPIEIRATDRSIHRVLFDKKAQLKDITINWLLQKI